MSECKKPRYFVEKKQKGGSILYYWQPGKGLTRLGLKTVALSRDRTKAMQEAEALNVMADRHRGGQIVIAKNRHGTLPWLIEEYKQDHKYKKLRPSSKQSGDWLIDQLLKWSAGLGDPPIRTIKRSDAKKLWEQWAEGKGKLMTATQLIGVACKLWNFALDELEDHDVVDKNPWARLGMKKPEPRQVVWEPEQITQFINQALITPARARGGVGGAPVIGYRKSIADAVMIIHNTTLRECDVVALTEANYDGHKITCVPSKTRDKTGFKFNCPATPELKAWLDDMLAARRSSNVVILHHQQDRPLVINEVTGQRYSSRGFQLRVREIRRAAGLPEDLWFEDLRRTAVVQLAEAGLTEAEICAFTGHSPSSVAQMMKIYRPTNIRMAEHGMAKLLEYRSKLKPEGTEG